MTQLPNGIEVEGLVREFKDVRAVDGIDLRVEPGEIYGFLGPNGAGKSTTVLMLTTLLPPTAGTARVAGHDIVREGAAVRREIGAALQEAALDPLLTGREHMRLQTALQGVAKAERRSRGDALLERVGLTEAADRKVRGYSGGMKRRLDLALALVHHPRILFLDEPTTGLDPQSRADMWQEVARLARDDGVTVFLTTQYLEEADVLADHLAIIDRGQIVARGTPEALKAEIGRPSLEVQPSERDDREAVAAVLERFGTPVTAAPGSAAVRLRGGVEELAEIVRALDGEELPVADFRLHAPTLDDVFLAKTGRKLEGGRARAGAGVRGQVYELARRSLLQTLRQPAMVVPSIVFPLVLVAVASGGLDSATSLPGFPGDSYLDFIIAVPFIQGPLFAMINAGSSLARDVENGFLKRLAMTPVQRAALLCGQLAGVIIVSLGAAVVYLVVGVIVGMNFESGAVGMVVLLALSLLIALAFAALGAFVGLRSGSGEAVQGIFPLFFVLLFLSSMYLPRPLIEQDWFRTIATYNPVSYLIEGIRSFIVIGWDGEAIALGFGVAAAIAVAALAGASAALRTRLVRT